MGRITCRSDIELVYISVKSKECISSLEENSVEGLEEGFGVSIRWSVEDNNTSSDLSTCIIKGDYTYKNQFEVIRHAFPNSTPNSFLTFQGTKTHACSHCLKVLL